MSDAPLQPIEAEGLGPAATAIILLLGVALAVLIWQGLRLQDESRVNRETQFYSAALTHDVEARLDALYEALRLRAEYWASPSVSSRAAAQGVEMFLTETPAAIAVMRDGPEPLVSGSEVGKRALHELVALTDRDATAPMGDRVVGPIVVGGRPVIGMRVRAGELEEERGTAFAAFDAETLLRANLHNRAFGYAIRVDLDGMELYRRGIDSPARELPRLAHSDPISPRLGKPWTLTVSPTSDVLPTSRIESPIVVLAAGFLAAALLSAAVHFGTVAWRRAKALGVANDALRRQVDEARRGEDELKRLSAELEERVTDRTAELEETIVELETFNYSASHDLRGPLGAIINFAAILSEDYKNELDATGQDHLARIIRSAGSAVSMMDALLAYSRSGRAELQRVHLDMRQLIDDVCHELAATHPGLPSALKVGDLPPAWADESMMRFVFANLIANACKFAKPDAAPQVEVGGSATPDETVYFVRDDGIGFDMRFADKLFKVFERLHPAQQYDGQGVGLAIVARMVRRHGGRVWAQGAVGKGATFYVSLPAKDGFPDGRLAS